MVTTFYGAHSFGGDAVYVDRLSRGLVRRGHEVHVVHCADAFRAVQANQPLRRHVPPPGVQVHTLRSRLGALSPLWTHQTGRLGPKLGFVQGLIARERFDVVHFHNVSLTGVPEVPADATTTPPPVKLMTAHDYWLVCPMHVLWKLDRRRCDGPQCLRCMVHGHRPPQLWRRTGVLDRAVEQLDALLCPSRHALGALRSHGVPARLEHLPYHIPADWALPASALPAGVPERPYFAAAGRLVKEKGFHRLVALMEAIPEVDLRLAGTGPYESELRRLAAERPNVRLVGQLDSGELAQLYRGARALVVPSLFDETFGYVVVEAFSVGTPAIVSNRGALPELIADSGAGIVFEHEDQLVAALRRLAGDDALRSRLAARALQSVATVWSEERHLDRYCALVTDARGATSSRS